jgi:error-prone DNA polymerase
VLERTLGVPLFQEQAMSLAVAAAGFTPGEADQLRRSIAAWKSRSGALQKFEARIIEGMTARGYPVEFARRCFEQIKGFSGYGFPESHAASFALLVYASSWLKRHHPAAFAAALLNSQPMGFYQPAQIVRDAQAHAVDVLPVDVNRSSWDCTLEDRAGALSLRLGMRMVKGLGEAHAAKIVEAIRTAGPFASIQALRRACDAPVASLRRLAEADAFGSMGLSRRAALWALHAERDEALPLFEAGAPAPAARSDDGASALPTPAPESEVASDYAAAGLSLRAHPMSFAREELTRRGVTPASALADPARSPAGARVRVAGLVLVRQRPGTASGIMFMTIEDETGIANLIVRPHVYERCRHAARHCGQIVCAGRIERQGEVVHVLARSITPLNDARADVPLASRDFH